MTTTRFSPVVVRELDRRITEALERSAARSTALRADAGQALDQLDVSDALDDEASDTAVALHIEAIALAVSNDHGTAELDAARHRLHSQSYGSCEACEAPIVLARLRTLPETRWCLRCSQSIEVQGRRLTPLAT